MNLSPIKEAQSSPISRLTVFVLLMLLGGSGWASPKTTYGPLVVGSWTDNELGPGDEDIPQNNEKPSDKKDPRQKHFDELEDDMVEDASGCWEIYKITIKRDEAGTLPSDYVLKLRENILTASKLCVVDNGRPKSKDERKDQPEFNRERVAFSLVDSAGKTVGGPWGLSINRTKEPRCPCYLVCGQQAEAAWWPAFPGAGWIHPSVKKFIVKSNCNRDSCELTEMELELGERVEVGAK